MFVNSAISCLDMPRSTIDITLFLRSFDHALPRIKLGAMVGKWQIIQAKRDLQKVDDSGNRLPPIAC
jgi:hypothetical protein